MTWRSTEWFEGRDELGLQSRSVLRSLGWSREFFSGKPVIGIANSWSELNNCNMSLKQVAEAVKRGVIAAGGVPLEFNTISLGEELMKPSAMLYRNLMAMEIEETLRAYPIDGVVLLTGCDKTTPGQLMGAASANLPAIQVCAGPRTTGCWKGRELASGTDLWHYLDEYRAGKINEKDWQGIEENYACSIGTCNSMGTASTMTVLSEALGMMLPGTATIPATDARRLRAAEQSGSRIVEMVREDIKPVQILTRKAFENALRVFMAIGGSTNAVIHLIAIAGRLRIPLTLDDFDAFARTTPMILNLQPAGSHLMRDFDTSGGVPALMQQIRDLLHLDCITAAGSSFDTEIESISYVDPEVIRPGTEPLYQAETLTVLYGNLAQRGAVLRTATASPGLQKHCGPALVFDSYDDMLVRIDDPNLPVTADSVLVLRNAGAVGVPGLPEWGSIPIPQKLLQQGIKDIVRISDSRMSGTSYGTIVLHITPEAAIGGTLALVEDGDLIELDVEERRLSLHVSEEELQFRMKHWTPPKRVHKRGYPRLYAEHVLQPDEGCDFDFLRPTTDAELTFIPPIVGRS